MSRDGEETIALLLCHVLANQATMLTALASSLDVDAAASVKEQASMSLDIANNVQGIIAGEEDPRWEQ